MATAYDDYDAQNNVDQSANNGNTNDNRDYQQNRNETDFMRNLNAKLEHGKIVKLMK